MFVFIIDNSLFNSVCVKFPQSPNPALLISVDCSRSWQGGDEMEPIPSTTTTCRFAASLHRVASTPRTAFSA